MNVKIFRQFFLFLAALSLLSASSEEAKKIEKKPRVTIITSVWNGDEYIEGFLADITRQTIFADSELILINANSPGNEEAVIKPYLERFPNIVYVKLEKDPGIYSVWNQAIKMAKSDLISNANLDDRSHPEALELHVKMLESDPSIDLVYGDTNITTIPNSKFETCPKFDKKFVREFSHKDMLYDCLPGPRPVWRKSMHERYGYFDPFFESSGDYEMWLRAVSQGSQFKKIDGAYVLYYWNPKGLSTDKNPERMAKRSKENIIIQLKYGSHIGPQ